ncbi:hypothetical protein [Agromyces seonyuensis]|uniref:Uncharacterized protein n=1 Tax=Agromyces seonyuensis TaxID=2662446 RepID=A0A6I4NXV4_9MICO|nr:hypothetical protein [Agromyces seonyuensis]MWB97972.1 hypothetical protein [Agromyces seonyuensis]
MDASSEQEAGRLRGRATRRRDRHEDDPTHVVDALKERVYATFTGLAIVLVLRASVEHLSPEGAFGTLAVGILAITLAGFAADVIAHLAVHAGFPDGAEFVGMLRVSGSALASASIPLILLLLAWVGVLGLEPALRIAAIVYVATLAVIAWFAVRRTRLAWWKQLLAMGILVAIGFAVIALQQLAHGH